MLDLRSHRTSPYQLSLISHRSQRTRTPIRHLPQVSPRGTFSKGQASLRHQGRWSDKVARRYFPSPSFQLENEQEMVLVQPEPIISRLCPELLAHIFHYVYITPVVHRPRVHSGSAEDQEQQGKSQDQEGVISEDLSSSDPSTLSASASSSSSTSSGTSTTTTSPSTSSSSPSAETDQYEPSTTSEENPSSPSLGATAKNKTTFYIQNDIGSMLALCLTCRAFYPQAVRMLWRQRTLANYDDLTDFYQAIDLASYRIRTDSSALMMENLITNEAALRIKSLTLLDMTLGSSVSSAVATSSLASSSDSVEAFSSQFFGSSTSHGSSSLGGGLDHLCHGIDSLPKTSSHDDINMMAAGYSKDPTRVSFASSSKRRFRQKTSSIYSEMVSPRLLHTIANHCYALVDLTLCMDNKPSIPRLHSNGTRSTPQAQPTIPFSILAGSLISLKRLTLMGLVCDSAQNRTGSELLVFAQNAKPLERLSIRSCLGLTMATLIEFAVRSHGCLKSLDFQGMDFKTEQELNEVMSTFAYHCRNLRTMTLSCLQSLSLDGMMEALVHYCAFQLEELHVLGHDTFSTQAQQPPVPVPVQGQDHHEDQVQIPITQMCQLTQTAFEFLAQIPLRRLTLYCVGMTDVALVQYLSRAPQLVDLVLHEPTTMLHHPQFHLLAQELDHNANTAFAAQQQQHNLIHPDHTTPATEAPETTPPATVAPAGAPTEMTPYTSARFLSLILKQSSCLKYLFLKLSVEAAQDWITQPCFQEMGLDKCLYQYRTPTGAPAIVLMWDARQRV